MILLACLVALVWLSVWAFSRPQRSEMFRTSNKSCVGCGRKWDEGYMLEFHHIVAVFEGGSDDPSNAELRCRECHFKAHKELARQRRKERNKRGAEGHEKAASQIAYRIRTKGLLRYKE